MELFECTIEGRSPIEPKTKKTENVWLYSIIARYPHPHLAEGEKKNILKIKKKILYKDKDSE